MDPTIGQKQWLYLPMPLGVTWCNLGSAVVLGASMLADCLAGVKPRWIGIAGIAVACLQAALSLASLAARWVLKRQLRAGQRQSGIA